MRRKSDSRTNMRKRSLPSLHFGVSEWCLAIAVCASLFAGGWAYAQGSADIFTGVIAVIGAVCLAIVALPPAAEVTVESAPAGAVFAETRWPFPIDQWGTGRAYTCKAANSTVTIGAQP